MVHMTFLYTVNSSAMQLICNVSEGLVFCLWFLSLTAHFLWIILLFQLIKSLKKPNKKPKKLFLFHVVHIKTIQIVINVKKWLAGISFNSQAYIISQLPKLILFKAQNLFLLSFIPLIFFTPLSHLKVMRCNSDLLWARGPVGRTTHFHSAPIKHAHTRLLTRLSVYPLLAVFHLPPLILITVLILISFSPPRD